MGLTLVCLPSLHLPSKQAAFGFIILILTLASSLFQISQRSAPSSSQDLSTNTANVIHISSEFAIPTPVATPSGIHP